MISPPPVDLDPYDTIIVAFSGKDSAACFLRLLELGVPLSKIELWHHEVDGREGSTLMDWPCTPAYVAAFGNAFGVPVYFSWKKGGFEREMLRKDTATAATFFEMPQSEGTGLGPHVGVLGVAGGKGPPGTRRKFPQVSPDLSVRWCSAYLKIDVCAASIRNQKRFNHARTLVVTGERREESSARAKYLEFEPHRADGRDVRRLKRHVDQWRAVIDFTERDVWEMLERHLINPHPAYRLSFGRVSCMKCIFGNADQWASVRAIDPAGFQKIVDYESEFGVTIKRKLNVIQTADAGTPYAMKPEDVRAAMSREFNEPIIMTPGTWRLPAGAYGDSCGPT